MSSMQIFNDRKPKGSREVKQKHIKQLTKNHKATKTLIHKGKQGTSVETNKGKQSGIELQLDYKKTVYKKWNQKQEYQHKIPRQHRGHIS